MSLASAIKVMHLFEFVFKPSFLFGAENNHRFLFCMLEFFNNIIQYQYEGIESTIIFIHILRKLQFILFHTPPPGHV
jgi:hypothetical protein